MADYIVRATAAGSQIRAFAATTRDLVEHARAAHWNRRGRSRGYPILPETDLGLDHRVF